MTLKNQIMKLQTYKMYEDEDTVYVERDDVLKALEQIELNPSEDAVIEWLKNKDIIKLSSQEEIARKELKELLSVTLQDQQPCDTPRNNLAKTSQDCISRAEAIRVAEQGQIQGFEWQIKKLCTLQPVTPKAELYEDCISRAYIEPIIEELENICINGDEQVLSMLADIKNAPPVTTKQKTGKWKLLGYRNGLGHVYNCSECGETEFYVSNYCPNCGCRMAESEG